MAAAPAPTAPVAYAEAMKPGTSVAVPKSELPGLVPVAEGAPAQEGTKVAVSISQQVVAAWGGTAQKLGSILAELPTARSQSVEFGALRHPELRLRRPIHLEVSVEDESVVVTWAEADEFGYGDTMGDALEDFARMLPELYFRLHESGVCLSSDLDRVRRVLDDYIEHQHA